MSTFDNIKPKYFYNRERINPAYPIFSEQDFDLTELRWYPLQGYATRTIRYVENGQKKRKVVKAHRVVVERMTGRKLKDCEYVDHLNRNQLDCRRENLCLVTRTQNNQNVTLRKTSRSGYRGVCFDKYTKSWKTQASFNGKKYTAGRFKTAEEANNAVVALRMKLGFHACHIKD